MLVLLALLVGPVIYYIGVARKRHDLFVRRIPGIDAIDEAIGRSAELGKPMTFTTGITSVGPTLYACLGVIHYVARGAACYSSKLFLPQYDPEVMAIAEDVVRDAYRMEGKLGAYDSRDMMYLSGEQFAYAAGYMGLVQREQVASAFLFGSFAAESLLLAEAGQQIGAMQVAASVSPEQVAFFLVTCDYTLIGEELFAASAYLSREPVQLGGVLGQDRSKLLIFLCIIVGSFIASWNALVPLTGLIEISNLDALITFELWPAR